MRIVLDAMGSDTCPEPELIASIEAVKLFGDPIYLVGPENLLKPKLQAMGADLNLVKIIHAPDVITMEDKGLQLALKVKRNTQTSMAVGMELIKKKEADAFVTAGNTGGALATGFFRLGTIPGVELPGLTALFPTRKGFCVVADIGANPDCKPENLVQFALMGAIYSRKVRQVQNPRIGLLSNGEEAGKGNDLVKKTYPLLQDRGLNFIGNVESKELFGGEADVVVTDGFSGNILLKTSEAVGKLIVEVMKEQITSSPVSKLGGLLAKSKLRAVSKIINPDEIGAVILLGLQGLVFVGHGRSNAHALVSAIHSARKTVEADILGEIQSTIQQNLDDAQKKSKEQEK
jgi:glycerol-3-phosphate acyltransferase PlsX